MKFRQVIRVNTAKIQETGEQQGVQVGKVFNNAEI